MGLAKARKTSAKLDSKIVCVNAPLRLEFGALVSNI